MGGYNFRHLSAPIHQFRIKRNRNVSWTDSRPANRVSNRAGGDALKNLARRQNTLLAWEKIGEEKVCSISSVYFVKHKWMLNTSFVMAVWLALCSYWGEHNFYRNKRESVSVMTWYHIRWYVSSVWNDPLPWCVRLSMILLLCGPKVEPRFNRSAAEVAHWRASYFHIFPLGFLFIFAQLFLSYLMIGWSILPSKYLWRT